MYVYFFCIASSGITVTATTATCAGGVNVGAIVGGVIGGLVLLGIIRVIVIACKKKKQHGSQPITLQPPLPHQPSSQPVSLQPQHPPPHPTLTPAPPSSFFTFTDPTITQAAPPPYQLHQNYSTYNGDPSTNEKPKEPPPYEPSAQFPDVSFYPPMSAYLPGFITPSTAPYPAAPTVAWSATTNNP